MKKIVLCLTILAVLTGCCIGNCKCDCETEKENVDNTESGKKYEELSGILFDYMIEKYNLNNKDTKLDAKTYVTTLDDFLKDGKDISMFVNSSTGKKCDSKNTSVSLIVKGIKDDGRLDYTFEASIVCD